MNFISLFQQHKHKAYAYDGLFNASEEHTEHLLDQVFETKGAHYCKGVYGICTLNANENDIVEKEIIIKKLIVFNQKFEDQQLSESHKKELLILNESFNKVTALFAPYQRTTSSRGKYVDRILNQNDLSEEIKNYG